jgi:phosphonopyruvate decarboxylase
MFNSDKKNGDETQKKVPDEDRPLTETVRYFLKPEDFYNLLKENKLEFYAGVPDSLLKDFCSYVADVSAPNNHVITANEGAAVGLATGYYLATRRYPIVYMQNSGFGNTINPLLSLADPKVYSIPMLLLIGWRGEPGKKDEPQHQVQGKVMSSLLTDLGIQYEVLPDYIEGARDTILTAMHYLDKRSGPYALLVKRQTFTPYKMKSLEPNKYEASREDALRTIVDLTGNWDVLVSTTGFTSRELYEIREQKKQDHRREFLTVGSMGHSGSIALGIAMNKHSRQVFCLDGDGAVLMHMGTLHTIGSRAPPNFKHIILNNGSHDSVGGQPTGGFSIDFPKIATACGYKHVSVVSKASEIGAAFKHLREVEGPALLEIRINKGARKDLGRPTTTPQRNKQDFMGFLDG